MSYAKMAGFGEEDLTVTMADFTKQEIRVGGEWFRTNVEEEGEVRNLIGRKLSSVGLALQ